MCEAIRREGIKGFLAHYWWVVTIFLEMHHDFCWNPWNEALIIVCLIYCKWLNALSSIWNNASLNWSPNPVPCTTLQQISAIYASYAVLVARWSRGMILALGARGLRCKSRTSPQFLLKACVIVFFNPSVLLLKSFKQGVVSHLPSSLPIG